MPAYDFKCTCCDRVYEVVRPAGQASPEPCPECGGQTKRVFSPVGVVFKGSGFHNTDYRSKPEEDRPSGESPCTSKDESSACSSCPAASDSAD